MKNNQLKLSIKILTFLIMVVFVGNFLITEVAASSVLSGVPCAQGGTKNSGGYEVAGDCGLCDLIRVVVNISNIGLGLSGSIALLMFVLAGVMMIASYTNPKLITQAKDTIKFTIIGLFLIFGAYSIINFTIMAFYGGSSNMGVFQQAYSASTGGQSDWGVCISK